MYSMTSYHGVNFEWEDRHVQSDDAVIGRVVYKPGGSCGPRVQQDFQLVMLHSGGCELRLDAEDHNLKVGHVHLLLPHREEHFRFSRQHETHHSWCAVSPQAIPGEMASQLRKASSMVPCSETMDALLATAFDTDMPSTIQAKMVVQSLAVTIFREYLHIGTVIASDSHVDACVARAVSYVQQHFPDTDCLQHCHEHAGVSRNTLIAKFRSAFHTTPNRYLWRLRTEKGVAMLLSTGLTVSEIAYRCGFQNPYHFSRKVSELQGMSPRELRRRAWLS